MWNQYFVKFLFFPRLTPRKYADLASVLSEYAPTAFKIANNASKHPVVAKYLAEEAHLPYSGLGLIWWILLTTVDYK